MANKFETINPFTNEHLATYSYHSDEEVTSIIGDVQKQWLSYRKTSYKDRAKMMRKAAEILETNKIKYAETITQEMGKVNSSALAEVEKCAWVCDYYAEHAETFLSDEIVKTDATKSYISYQPLGIVLAIMPWNYPFWQVFRYAAPTLMAGNGCILKHASNVPATALIIEDVFREAGFPEDIFRSLLIKSSAVEKVIGHQDIKAVTLTGSEFAGSKVAAQAGEHLKKTVLELGGSDPYIILADADINHAVDQCVTSRLLNAGQSCIGAKRFILHEKIYDDFLAGFYDKMSNAMIGDPMQQVDLGPMARHDLRDEVHQQVLQSLNAGAALLLGGRIPDHEGAFYPPTILTEVAPGMDAYDEEIFGPVASVIKADDDQDAIRIANDSKYGLGACIFSQDVDRAEALAKQELQAGCCFVNQYVKSDPRLPFGGINKSGYGRELSYYGIREFTNIKSIYIK